MKVEFKFESDDLVETKLGTKGMIETCAVFQDRSLHYSVKTKDNCHWWKEEHLKKTNASE